MTSACTTATSLVATWLEVNEWCVATDKHQGWVLLLDRGEFNPSKLLLARKRNVTFSICTGTCTLVALRGNYIQVIGQRPFFSR